MLPKEPDNAQTAPELHPNYIGSRLCRGTARWGVSDRNL
jgi:hypothetical protein